MSGVVTREGLSVHGEVGVLLRVDITVDVWRVAAPLDIDEERRVPHHVLPPRRLVRVGVQLQHGVLLTAGEGYQC